MKTKLFTIGMLLAFTISCKEDTVSDPLNTVSDVDGNVYKTVTIGTQVWMAENLKTTKYNDGTTIPLVTDSIAWLSLTTPGYCWYRNHLDNKSTYGVLYNWYTVNTNKLCPTGWHVPSEDEWSTLELYLQNNGYNYDGTIDTDTYRETNNKTAKSLASLTNWSFSSVEGSVGDTNYSAYRNKSGFAALPGGYIGNGTFYGLGYYGNWWTATELNNDIAFHRGVYFNYNGLDGSPAYKQNGFSVRCVKDN
jgi:uncharacterized protein (TIGR02145 family)